MLKHRNAPNTDLEQVARETVEPVITDRHGYSYVETHKVNSAGLQELVTAAVQRALEEQNGNIIVVNLNIQVAHGGGAKNFWNGNDNERWERR